MSDFGAVLLALVAAGGAWTAWPVPLPLAVAVVGVALAGRWPVLLVVGAGLLTASLSARSWSGLHPPQHGAFSGVVTLVGDPAQTGAETRVELRVGNKRVEAWAHGMGARALTDRLAGERVVMTGRLESVPPGACEADDAWSDHCPCDVRHDLAGRGGRRGRGRVGTRQMQLGRW